MAPSGKRLTERKGEQLGLGGNWEQQLDMREVSGWKQGARDEEGMGEGQRWLEWSKAELEEKNPC